MILYRGFNKELKKWFYTEDNTFKVCYKDNIFEIDGVPLEFDSMQESTKHFLQVKFDDKEKDILVWEDQVKEQEIYEGDILRWETDDVEGLISSLFVIKKGSKGNFYAQELGKNQRNTETIGEFLRVGDWETLDYVGNIYNFDVSRYDND